VTIFLAWLLGVFTEGWSLKIPDQLSDFYSFFPMFVIGVLYYILPLRNQSNRRYFDQVTGNLRTGLLEIASAEPSVSNEWPKIRKVFFKIIDSDDSLKVQASRAMFNGFIWTTIADVRALCAFFALASLLIFLFSMNKGALGATIVFSVSALISLPLSAAVTKRHIDIGNEQLSIIRMSHRKMLKELLSKIDE
jgi:hypothetical protein